MTRNPILLVFFFLGISALCPRTSAQSYSTRSLACGLSQPWEIKFGPDGWLWVTEAHSYQLSRVDPATGNTEMMLDLSVKKDFPNFNTAVEWPQGGLQGFAFHPSFGTNPYIYLAYVHHFDSCKTGTGGCFFKTRIVRYDYNTTTKVFSNETIITDTLPGSSDHNGGRLVAGPPSAAGAGFLFYSIGDMGAGHLGNGSRAHHGQQLGFYEGKVLRYNLVSDGDAGGNAWIPNNNPFNSGGAQSAVWSLGHRNPQGLAFAPDGTLYESEHGPYSDDELNIIKSGHNYGFPLVVGFADGNYDGSKSGAGSGAPPITSETANKTAIQAAYPYSDPIFSFFPASQSTVSTIYTNNVNNTPPYANYNLQWPSTAPSGIEHYSSTGIQGWAPSLLVTNLKIGSVYRLKLSADGQSVVGDTISLFQGLGRFRDLAVSSDGLKIYAAADSVGNIKGAPGTAVTPPNKGCIMEFSFSPTGVAGAPSDAALGLYPNPASEAFVLQLPAGTAAADVSLYNALGQAVDAIRVTAQSTSIPTRHLPRGVYTVRVTSERRSWSSRLVVE